ncbi:acetyl-CoA synthetase-like protein [Penicillium atrosanguineum]|nr:acetyl-CoA synthetase-like protein [Penicillium atrosanguineum]
MNLSHDLDTISLALSEGTLTAWSTERGNSTLEADLFKAAWIVLISRISGVRNTKIAMLQKPAVSPSNRSRKLSRFVPHVEAWTLSEDPDSILLYAAEKQPTEGLAELDAMTALVMRWDDDSIDGSMTLPHGFRILFLLDCSISPARVYMQYSRATLTQNSACAQLAALVCILEQRVLSPYLPLIEVDFLGSYSRNLIDSWNDRYSLSRPNVCIHTLILENCRAQPDAEALYAWDGSITYSELDRFSTAISIQLRFLGVGPESVVPLCFEKSRWTAVAMLGVLRAGGAFVLLDPSHPETRLMEICSEVQATVVVVSRLLHKLGSRLCQQAVVVPGDKSQEGDDKVLRTCVKPSNAAYIAFTSGSTGKPKGIVIEHKSFCANALAQNAIQGLNTHTRAFQFASYGFDSCILEMLMTLIAGGCVCIPSDEQRLNGLANAICALRANWLELTPSVARFIKPEQVPDVKSVLLVGEAMSQDHVRQWADRVQLLNAYGPAECSVVTTIQHHARLDDPHNIGRSYSSHCWVVNPCDHEQLEPLGAIGELLISGPTVARGYLNHPRQTSFIRKPRWAAQFGVPDCERFYKTGDLVRYNIEDGTLRYVGRKDREVKLHGQRIDLQEIEYVASKFPEKPITVVDVIQVDGSSAGKLLTLFLASSDANAMSGSSSSHVVNPDSAMRTISTNMKCWLQDRLPAFMVPTKYTWVNHYPLTRTGKLDRRALVDLGAGSSPSFSSAARHDSSKETNQRVDTLNPGLQAKEDTLRSLFAEILGCPEQSIARHDGFYELGGNSLAAVELVSRARSQGLEVTVADVMYSQTAHLIAQCSMETAETPVIPPFSLLVDADQSVSAATEQCQIPESQIDDIYPCTPLQEGLMYLSIKSPGSFMGTFQFSAAPSTNLVQIHAAWEQLWRAHPILRTRIVLEKSGNMMQVVTKADLFFKDKSFADDDQPMGLGTPLARLRIHAERGSGRRVLFILTIHHVLFDGWSYKQLLQDLDRFYEGLTPPPRPQFARYIKYLSTTDIEKSRAFWKQEFSNLQEHFFPLSSRRPPTAPNWLVRKHEVSLAKLNINWKLANQIKLAWALVISSQTKSNDVIYGLTVSGRNAPIPEIDHITGPTFTTLPFRTQLSSSKSVEEMLSQLQEHDISIIPFEHNGLRFIAESSPEAALACSFQYLLTIRLHPTQSSSSVLIDLPENEDQDMKFASYPLSIVAQQRRNFLEIKAFFDGKILSPYHVQTILDHFETSLQHVLQKPKSKIRDLRLLPPRSWQQMAEINKQIHIQQECLNDVIQRFSITQPSSEAVCAWDGSLTYEELLVLGRGLAGHLQSMGARPGAVIGICMERSKLFPVAILGVLMSGAAMVLLEPQSPMKRLHQILGDANARMILCSLVSQGKFQSMTENMMKVIPVIPDMVSCLAYDSWSPPSVNPSDPMYIAFTSGSTGTPKGVVIEHGMVYSTLWAHKDIIGATNSSRCLLFASPAFDICIAEVIFMLGTGGCVCVPSETQRMSDLADTMTMMRVNMAMLTPSVVRTISPDKVPTLQTLILGGESPSVSDLATWASRVRLHQSYGPAECTMYSATTARLSSTSDLTNVGSSPNASYWIIDPDNHDELRPIGTVGELLISGPLVGRGYINRPEESECAFIFDPAWSQQFPFLRGSRLYKTGDLAILNPDKSLILIGRKDTQVKLHGQRIELHEIEHCAESYQQGSAVIAELVEFHSIHTSSLVMFAYNTTTAETTVAITPDLDGKQRFFIPPSTENQCFLGGLRKHLSQHLPSYMIPSYILELSCVPLGPSGKVDRKTLRKAASMLGKETLQMYLGGLATTKTEPKDDQQRFIQSIFAKALALKREFIGVDDSFFALGGDSISAIRVLTLCRKSNITISMSDILSHDTVSSLCAHLNTVQKHSPECAYDTDVSTHNQGKSEVTFMPLGNAAQEYEIIRSRLNLLESDSIEGVYPASNAHSGVLEFYNLENTSTAIFQILPVGSVSANEVSHAWNQLVQRHVALRTVLLKDPNVHAKWLHVTLNQGTAQVLVLPPSENALSELRKLEPVKSWHLSPPHRLFIGQSLSGEVFMRLETGGALIDAFSMSILIKELSVLLDGQTLPKIAVTYREYLSHFDHQLHTKSLKYWALVLHGDYSSHLSRLPSTQALENILPQSKHRTQSRSLSLAKFKEFDAFWRFNRLTVTNIFQLAWALTLANLTNSHDVCFGTITSGRENSQIELWDIVGSFFNILPCRFSFDPDCTILDTLYQNQDAIQSRNDHQNCSMPEMVHNSDTKASKSDQLPFNTILTVQNQVSTHSHGERHTASEIEIKLLELEDPTEYDFCIAVSPSPSQIGIELRYWTSTASEEYASSILNLLIDHVDLIVQSATEPLRKVISIES